MTLIDRIRAVFHRDPPPTTLRNKPQGYAWIKPFGHEYGAQVLAGRAVKTVRLTNENMWALEPPQPYRITGDQPVRSYDTVAHPGDGVLLVALHDALLEPWKEDGITQSDVRKLYAPRLPNKERDHARNS